MTACSYLMIDEIGYARKVPLLRNYALEHKMVVLMANYSGVTGGEVSAGKSALWSEDDQLVAASTGTEEALVVDMKQNGVWNGVVCLCQDLRRPAGKSAPGRPAFTATCNSRLVAIWRAIPSVCRTCGHFH